MVERMHRRLKDALRARCAADTWAAHLPWVLLGLRSTPREEDGRSPAQAVLGSDLILPGQFLTDSEVHFDSFIKKFENTLRSAESTVARHNIALHAQPPRDLPTDLAAARLVFVRRDGHVPLLTPLYEGPYSVVRRSLHHFTVKMGDREEVISKSRLKTCNDETATPAEPRRRGRPPGPRHVWFRLQPVQPPRCRDDQIIQPDPLVQRPVGILVNVPPHQSYFQPQKTGTPPPQIRLRIRLRLRLNRELFPPTSRVLHAQIQPEPPPHRTPGRGDSANRSRS